VTELADAIGRNGPDRCLRNGSLDLTAKIAKDGRAVPFPKNRLAGSAAIRS
jgi:hypothetical protein